jgi:serine protease inhibitor
MYIFCVTNIFSIWLYSFLIKLNFSVENAVISPKNVFSSFIIISASALRLAMSRIEPRICVKQSTVSGL